MSITDLKRFSYTTYRRTKLETPVQFPIKDLTLKPVTSPHRLRNNADGKDAVYDLFGISHHVGGLGGGHYYANVRNLDDGMWYLKNDASVSKLVGGPDNSAAASAYVLFYKKRR